MRTSSPAHSSSRAPARFTLEPLERRALLSGGGASLDVPQLSSLPGASKTLYLDFRGTQTSTSWGFQTVPPTPAYSVDADTTSFSQTELDNIDIIWRRVAEKYSPFQLNVTTVDPGVYPYGQVTRVVIGGNGSWTGGTFGGMAYANGFFGASSNTAWVFPDNLAISNHGYPKYVAESIAHESGHTFGLQHQSTYKADGTIDQEYYAGDGSKAPIMGKSYYVRGVWWNGTSTSATTFQDDLAVLSSALGYRADDHPNSLIQATPLAVLPNGNASASGIIETMDDVDVFSFTSMGGLISLTGDPATYGAMLDLKLTLLDSSGNMVASADTTSLAETIDANLAPGQYFLEVASHGSYGDIGQYTITGGNVPEPGTIGLMAAALAMLLQRRDRSSKAGHPWRA